MNKDMEDKEYKKYLELNKGNNLKDYCKLYKTMMQNPNYFKHSYVETVGDMCRMQNMERAYPKVYRIKK